MVALISFFQGKQKTKSTKTHISGQEPASKIPPTLTCPVSCVFGCHFFCLSFPCFQFISPGVWLLWAVCALDSQDASLGHRFGGGF